MKSMLTTLSALLLVGGLIGCSAPLTTRERGAIVGTTAGAGLGAIIGSATGHAGAGAGIGGLIGLGTGALIGDKLQEQEEAQSERDKQLDHARAELEQQKRKLEELRKQREL